VIFGKSRKLVITKTGDNYPAPLAALDAVERGLQYGLDAGLEHEAAHFSELAVGDVSRNLVRLFFAGTALKKAYSPTRTETPPRPITNIAIVGSGITGSAIAGVAAARAGVDVRLRDKDIDCIVKGLESARNVPRDLQRKGRIDVYEMRRMEALLTAGVDWAGFGRADLVIEAVSEDLDLKRQVAVELESQVPDDCIVASNTSTISISRIAESVGKPQRVVGMHFLSPVAKMPLLEVVAHEATAPWVVSSAVEFGQAVGKTVIVVKDSPGFWVNRLLAPYLHEAWTLLEEGVDAESIDLAMTEFGFPFGPITLLDEVGLDVINESLAALQEIFGDRLEPKKGLEQMVSEGRLGRKTGSGLFTYRRGKKRRFDQSVYELIGATATPPAVDDELSKRLAYPLLNEAARALDEGVVSSPRDGDLGAIYGMGFPPFRGGPLRHIDEVGVTNVVDTLEALRGSYGDRFAPAPCLIRMAERNDEYYERDQ
jgi:3-hydroxyacyl-CoA dehydrogenase/enoyl-CoA hydratase/3-hydroxybutyryl-CoA epimerase